VKYGSRLERSVPWRRHQLVLYFTSILIFVRSIFRFAEYALGKDGELLQHEYWSYIFDACLMVLTMVAFNVVYPGEIGILIKKRKGRKGQGSSMELIEEAG
jgi:hypothetical protein